jgi:rRNA biogenesis protein RRP5
MPGKKRASDDQPTPRTRKKSKLDNGNSLDQSLVSNTLSEVDFPRGGGTSFTPLEVKAIRAEGAKEADEELFEVSAPVDLQVLRKMDICDRICKLEKKRPKRKDVHLTSRWLHGEKMKI